MSFRWGIIGCGTIAPKFFESMEKTGEGEVVAAASRSMYRARRFQQKTGVDQVYHSYEKMLDREKLDAVYIATSHNFHFKNAALCLKHGLPVLVEKTFTQNAVEAEKLIQLARAEKLFLMEAMWMRFNPAIVKLRELLQSGVIGEAQRLQADFCIRMNRQSPQMLPWNRMANPRLAGGALLDLGIYAVSLASMVFAQPPARIGSTAKMTWTGVDATSEYNLDYPGGHRAELRSSFRDALPFVAVLTGTRGIIRVPDFAHPSRLIVSRPGRAVENLDIEPERLSEGQPGFQHEIREVHRCLREGLIESEVMPLDETLEIMRTLDTCRAQWGMRYPGE